MRSGFLLFVFTLAPAGVISAQTSNDLLVQRLVGQPVVRVNGSVLTQRDLLREMFSIFPYARTHNGFPKAMEADIRKGALQMIEFEELVYQEALRRRLTLAPEKLERAQADFRKQFSTEADYQSYLKTEVNGSLDTLRKGIRRSLLIDQMLKTEVADRAVVTVAGAKAFYDQNPDRFRIPESYTIQTISILPPTNATPAQMKEAANRASVALRQAGATKGYSDFGLLAEKTSDDDFRVNMGDHKAVERGKLPPPIAQALLTMQPGQISGLIRVDQAYTIVRLNNHIAAGMQSFNDVKDSLRKQLEKEKSEQLRQALNKRLRAAAKVEEL